MFEPNILICMVNKFISFSQGRPNASMQEKEQKGRKHRGYREQEGILDAKDQQIRGKVSVE